MRIPFNSIACWKTWRDAQFVEFFFAKLIALQVINFRATREIPCVLVYGDHMIIIKYSRATLFGIYKQEDCTSGEIR